MEYGIGVKNRYQVFLDEDVDPLEVLSKTQEDKGLKVSNRKALDAKTNSIALISNIKDNKTIAKDPQNKPKPSDGPQSKTQKEIRGDANRNNRQNKTERPLRSRELNQTGDKTDRTGNSDRQNRPPHRSINEQRDIEEYKNQRNKPENFGNSKNLETEFRERRERSDSDRRPKSSRNGNSRRGRLSGDSRGKRDLDRHSGSDKSGVKPTEKREGGGAHNWGKFNDFNQLEEPSEGHDITDRSGDENALEANEQKEDSNANAHEDDVQKEIIDEGPKEKTLEEYQKEMEELRLISNFNLRKPGEGEDTSQWKKTVALPKKKNEDEEEVEYEEIEVEEDNRKGRGKQVLDIEINFRDEGKEYMRRGGDRRGRGGPRSDRGSDRGERGDRGNRDRDRGDRGGERGGRGRGGDRTFEPSRGRRGMGRRDGKEQTAPKVDDWNDFPSLAS